MFAIQIHVIVDFNNIAPIFTLSTAQYPVRPCTDGQDCQSNVALGIADDLSREKHETVKYDQ